MVTADFLSQSVYDTKEKEFERRWENGRSDRIRTCDFHFPNREQLLSQAKRWSSVLPLSQAAGNKAD